MDGGKERKVKGYIEKLFIFVFLFVYSKLMVIQVVWMLSDLSLDFDVLNLWLRLLYY